MIATSVKQEKAMDIELRRELSDFLAQKFMCRKNCPYCWNTGVRVFQKVPNSEFQYVPCFCLMLRKDIKNGKTPITSTKK